MSATGSPGAGFEPMHVAGPAGAPEAAPEPLVRERGWGRLLVALALFFVFPAPLVPVVRQSALLFAALSGFMIAGWRVGGPWWPAVAWPAVTAMALARPSPSATPTVDALQAAFTCLLGVAAGMSALWRRPVTFISRALAATAGTLAVSAGLAVTIGPGPTRLAEVVRERYASRAAEDAAAVRQGMAAAAARDTTAEGRAVVAQFRQVADQWQAVAPGAFSVVSPALLALDALAALALGWALYHRLARRRLGPPLARLAEFRFPDGLVWGIVAGVAILVVPGLASLRGVAANLLVFTGLLYAIRGVGVLWYFAAPGPVLAASVLVAGVVLWNVVLPGAACLGISDTWIDWRRRAKAPAA